jgi:fused signal recognition particle receptor
MAFWRRWTRPDDEPAEEPAEESAELSAEEPADRWPAQDAGADDDAVPEDVPAEPDEPIRDREPDRAELGVTERPVDAGPTAPDAGAAGASTAPVPIAAEAVPGWPGVPGWPRLQGPAAQVEAAEDAAELALGVQKSRQGFMGRLRTILGGADASGPSWDDVEETLIAGDVGGALAMEIVERARRRHDPGGPEAAVRAELAAILAPADPGWRPGPSADGAPAVLLVVGVNGTGKTTTIGKLADRYHREGARVILAAADTFRAAAIDQLRIWADRTGSEIVAHAPGADPGAVVYDALDAAAARGADVVIADTAGRLHTKTNLMDELAKIRRIVDKRFPGAAPEVLFVLDATTGQNGLAQARSFHETAGITGIVLTKLDSTAKGGIVFAIEDALGVPVRYVGVGERASDLVPFDPEAFVAALFA